MRWKRAVLTGICITATAVPWRLTLFPNRGLGDLTLFSVIQFMLATLLADAALAWGDRGGLAGFLPALERVREGVTVAVGSLVVLLPLHILTDPFYRSRLAATAHPKLLAAAYPETLTGKAASILWTSGFEVLFFYAFAMVVTVRVGGGKRTAILVAISVRLFVSILALAHADLLSLVPLGLPLTLLTGVAIAISYARGGFPAAALLAALLRSRLFLLVGS